MHSSRWIWGIALCFSFACAATTPFVPEDAGEDAAVVAPPSVDASAADASKIVFADASHDADATAVCHPPQVLLVLDRSNSMDDGPDGGLTKWDLAQAAVDDVTAPPTDNTVRFGLELMPNAPLQISDAGFCGTGDIAVPLGLTNGALIGATLKTTDLYAGTPIGGALSLAEKTLAKAQQPDVEQYVVIVTDGKDTCSSTPALPIVQAMATAGVKTFVIGFGNKVDGALLDDLACAGETAANFATSCTKTKTGYVASASASQVFIGASDGAALQSALATITGGVCCGCVVH